MDIENRLPGWALKTSSKHSANKDTSTPRAHLNLLLYLSDAVRQVLLSSVAGELKVTLRFSESLRELFLQLPLRGAGHHQCKRSGRKKCDAVAAFSDMPCTCSCCLRQP